jgi:hypothetical protein
MTETDDDTPTISTRRARVRANHAWQRLLLGDDGALSPDAKVCLRELMDQAQWFGRQYELGNPERTLELAVRRQTVIHILVALNLTEADAAKLMEIQRERQFGE